jgi:GT2 family glycosyltransferase/tetratricopeptide (TPR) repeat protein
MSQPSVTVVIPVWNQWQFTKGCLDSLRPTLGIRDEVIVVDNGSEDFTPQGLKQFPWVKVITNEVNQGFAIACNQGAAEATNEIIIFLNNDTLVPNRWIDGLIAPFDDETVVATGPRSNMVSGPQMVEEADYAAGSMPDLKRFAKKWRDDHRGQYSEFDRLVGFCIAVRKNAFDAINGFDEEFETGGAEDDDLCMRLIENGGRLLIAHESFVHHHGHATFDGNNVDWFAIQEANLDRLHKKHFAAARDNGPLVSACMITKNEEELIAQCLASLENFVDEVVIYDTGSTDRTIEIARNAGATVIEGYWDDDFGRARNAALEHCKGEWVLHIDADEELEGGGKTIRHILLTAPISAWQVEVLNLSGGGAKNDLIHRPCRLFKRRLYHWEGRLHEQVTFRDGIARDDFGVLPGARIIHHGYTPEMMTSRNKAERNIRIAEIDAETDDGRDPMDKLTNLGRSYTLSGKNEEALELYRKARTFPVVSPVTARTLFRAGAQAALAADRPEDALEWINDLATASDSQDTAHFLRGTTLADMGRWEEALEELEGLGAMRDDDGVVFPIFKAQFARGKCYFALERFSEAADEFAEVAKEDASDEPIWALVAESFHKTDRDLHTVLQTISPAKINSIFAQIVTASPEAADRLLDALYDDAERRPNVLALAIRIAPNLPAARCLEWSARLRAVGMGDHCPLIARANGRDTEPVEALRCAALAHVTFGDDRALQCIEIVSAMLPLDDFDEAVVMMDGIQPALLGALILAASNTAERCFGIAQKLRELGAEDQAVAVVLHGRSLPSGGSIALDAAAWLESFGRVDEAAVMRSGEA